MENILCPICEIDDSQFLYDKERDNNLVNYVICKECGLVYQNPRMCQAEFSEYYKNAFRSDSLSETELNKYIESRINVGKEIFSITTNVLFNNRFNYLKRMLTKYRNLSVLDIGCGVGGVLIPFIEAGYKCKGIDAPSYYTKIGKDKLGVNIDEIFISDFISDSKYDIIILNHSLEHFLDPITYCVKIKSLLKNNGILYVEVPNIEKPYDWTTLQYFFMLGHVFYYSPLTLNSLMNKSGFNRVFIDNNSTPFMKNIFVKKNNGNYTTDPTHFKTITKTITDRIT